MLQVATEHSLRLGVVSFLNTSPLISGLEELDNLELIPKVPSELIGDLERGSVDLALASSIDYQKTKLPLNILNAGVLSSDGETLTVKLCSKIPFKEMDRVWCDTDSHTSVALLQIVMRRLFSKRIKVVPIDVSAFLKLDEEWPPSVLMIGDKVVTTPLPETFTYELDLGAAWLELTNLPFVFAIWIGNANLEQAKVEFAKMVLDRQRRCNAQRIEQIAFSSAAMQDWDSHKAYQYLSNNMQYICNDKHVESLELFYQFALEEKVIDKLKPLNFYSTL